MREVNVYEAKTSLSALLRAVTEGEEIVITRRNKPIARLVPFQPTTGRPTFSTAREALQRSGLGRDDIARALEPMTEDELAAWGLAWSATSPTPMRSSTSTQWVLHSLSSSSVNFKATPKPFAKFLRRRWHLQPHECFSGTRLKSS